MGTVFLSNVMPKKIYDALSDTKLRGVKPGDAEYKMNDGRGLVLVVRPTGARLWRLRFRFAGKERMLALGEYPDVGLKVARERAAAARDLVAQGIDPVQDKREQVAKRVNAARQTFETVANEWIAKKAESKTKKKWSAGHIEQNRQSLRDYVFPKIGRRPVGSLTAQDIMQVLEPLEQAGKLETLRRVRQRVGAVLAYAVQTGRRTDNPIRDIAGAFDAPERTHFASIKADEVKAFLGRLDAYQGHPSTKGIIRMILWTASRTGEIRGATWDEFDLDAGRWTVPAERMKKRRPHVVPLPAPAVAMLRELRNVNTDRWVFASPNSVDQMASENIVLQALKKMGYGGKLTGHGLRATVSTGLEEMGFPIEIIKAQLSHAKDNLTDATYLRGIHIERRTAMMAKWADWLDGKPADNIVVLPERGAA